MESKLELSGHQLDPTGPPVWLGGDELTVGKGTSLLKARKGSCEPPNWMNFSSFSRGSLSDVYCWCIFWGNFQEKIPYNANKY